MTVRTRPEPMPYAGGRVFHVYPHGFKGTKIEPSFEGLMCAYNYYVRRHRLGDRGTAARESRATRSWCTPALYKYNRYEYTNDAAGQPHRAARRHLLPDRRRHAPRCRSSIKARRRRRGDLRRRRQLHAVRRQGRRLHLLRRADLPEHRDRDLGGHAVHRRLEGTDGEALPVRGRRRGRLHQLLGLEQLLHRRQLVPRPQRSEAPDRLERRRSGSSSTASRARSFRR